MNAEERRRGRGGRGGRNSNREEIDSTRMHPFSLSLASWSATKQRPTNLGIWSENRMASYDTRWRVSVHACKKHQFFELHLKIEINYFTEHDQIRELIQKSKIGSSPTCSPC